MKAAAVIQEGLRLSGTNAQRLFQFGYLMFYLNHYDEMRGQCHFLDTAG